MSHDSEIAQTFRAMKEARKEKKAARLDAANPDGWTQHTPYHWSRIIDGEKLNYWPSTGLCMYKNKRTNINSKRVKALLERSQ